MMCKHVRKSVFVVKIVHLNITTRVMGDHDK